MAGANRRCRRAAHQARRGGCCPPNTSHLRLRLGRPGRATVATHRPLRSGAGDVTRERICLSMRLHSTRSRSGAGWRKRRARLRRHVPQRDRQDRACVAFLALSRRGCDGVVRRSTARLPAARSCDRCRRFCPAAQRPIVRLPARRCRRRCAARDHGCRAGCRSVVIDCSSDLSTTGAGLRTAELSSHTDRNRSRRRQAIEANSRACAARRSLARARRRMAIPSARARADRAANDCGVLATRALELAILAASTRRNVACAVCIRYVSRGRKLGRSIISHRRVAFSSRCVLPRMNHDADAFFKAALAANFSA